MTPLFFCDATERGGCQYCVCVFVCVCVVVWLCVCVCVCVCVQRNNHADMLMREALRANGMNAGLAEVSE